MSGSTGAAGTLVGVQPVSGLPVAAAGPASSDQILGSFGGTIQFVTFEQFTSNATTAVQSSIVGNVVGKAGGAAALSSLGGLVLNGVEVFRAGTTGAVTFLPNLPTSDPGNNGQLWNNGGYLAISNGGA